MAGTFNTIFITERILKLPELNHSAEIYVTCYFIDKLLNYDLILCKDILHKLGIIFNFENKTITWHWDSISMKTSNCRAKEFFEIKENCPVRNATKQLKQILDAKHKKVNIKSIVMSLNHF